MNGDFVGPAFTFRSETGDPAEPDGPFTDRFTPMSLTQRADDRVTAHNVILHGVENGGSAAFTEAVFLDFRAAGTSPVGAPLF
ncbi:hypothetical protein [Jannaschia seohaensis]|uniref:Uncharacterized protein n=1 Tax=Jannaschia seohaensis TaxID=475081 RepID=A0A2Y9C0B2_9RHOB|nr:hypothetical protein [Jannaschia seohaensis]PWJ19210.1 hypothetical protein BCF38_104142 [Jannaschia seohaensis]SSA45872.1 hypothetical protein SAMN05421539_104142 [Jannaschia seohaensis]